MSCVVSSVFTSRPLRHPSAHRARLTGFTQLDPHLPPPKVGGDGRTSGPFLHSLSPHAAGLTPGPLQVLVPFASLQTSAFPLSVEGRRVAHLCGFVPSSDSPSDDCPTLRHGAAPFASCYGLRIWRTPLAGFGPDLFSRAVRGVLSRQVRPACCEPAFCLHTQKGNWCGDLLSCR
jgi:hypothetical protein